MLDFFTDPYKDELIYSAIARYHFYSGNVDFKDTIEECFGKRTMVPVFEFAGRLDVLAGSICKTNSIRYCPICAKKEIEAYGEVYIHREHQVQGIKLCPHDGCVLKEYDKNYILARNVYYLLNTDLSMFDNQKIKERYVYYLNKKDLHIH